MGFNVDKFKTAPFVLRTGHVDVPELADMFDDGEKPVFQVRGLDGSEWGLAKESVQKRRDMAVIMRKMASGNGADIADAVSESLGLNDKKSAADALRFAIFHAGLVEPALSDANRLDLARRLHRFFPTVFDRITDKISYLTGTSDQGEASGSGKAPTSKPRSRSATKRGSSSTKRSRT